MYLVIVLAIFPPLEVLFRFPKKLKIVGLHAMCFTTLTIQILGWLSGWDSYNLKGEAFDRNVVIPWQLCSV